VGTADCGLRVVRDVASVSAGTHIVRVPTDTIRVIAAVIADGDRLLVCQRPPHKRHGGLWEFPGGKCEPGESDAEAAERELREELGITVMAVGAELAGFHDPGSPFLIAFVPVQIAGEPVCHEHSALRWGTLRELAELPLAPSDCRFVEAMLAHDVASRASASTIP
jgi:mutator protein MutT